VHPGNGKRKNAFRYECNKRTENVIKEHEMVEKLFSKIVQSKMQGPSPNYSGNQNY